MPSQPHWMHVSAITPSENPVKTTAIMRFPFTPSVLFLISSSSLHKEQQLGRSPPLLYAATNSSHPDDAAPQPHPATTTPQQLSLHHTALHTSNITRAMDFYSLLGFHCVERFRAGPARAAWLAQHDTTTTTTTSPRRLVLELIEVPPHLLASPARAPDRWQTTGVLGYHHVALEVVLAEQDDDDAATADDLASFVSLLNTTSYQRFGKYLRVATTPGYPPRQQQQQRIGMAGIYDVCFLYDADGCLVELIHQTSNVTTTIQSGWEPWDGSGFQM